MRLILAALFCLPAAAYAAGDGADIVTQPPTTTETTATCKSPQIWDPATAKCVNPRGAALDAQTLHAAVRELAYAGRYADAQAVLRAMPDQHDDRVLTYWGFTHRKLGNAALAEHYYQRAIARNPDNLLARSYMGQGLVEDGQIDAALAQWREIRARGGTGGWAETSLRQAIRTGVTFRY